MADTLWRLVYVSRNLIVGSDDTILSEVQGILDVARRNNEACGVSGALMFNAGCFAQVLEGEQHHVEDIFERIQNDERHRNIAVLAFDEVADRAFSSWSMAYVGADTQAHQSFALLAEETGFDPSALPADRVFTLLREQLLGAERTGQGSSGSGSMAA